MDFKKANNTIEELSTNDFTVAQDGFGANGNLRNAVYLYSKVLRIDVQQAMRNFNLSRRLRGKIIESDDD